MAFRYIRLVLILVIILTIADFTKNETKLNYNVLNDTQLKPLYYDVKIKFDVYKNIFFGKCKILIQINRPLENIAIMSSGIFSIVEIDLIMLTTTNVDINQTSSIIIPKFSFINIPLNKTYIYLNFAQSSVNSLSPGRYILKIIYVSSILDDGDFFESIYTDREKGNILKDRDIKVIKAAELFPCWDKPVFKSTFKIAIRHHKYYKFLSSMPIRQQVEDMDNMLWTHFDESYLIPAHLTIVITTLTNSSTAFIKSFGNANIKFWYRKEITNQMRFAEYIIHEIVCYLKQKHGTIIPKIDYFVIKDFQRINFQRINGKTRGFILLPEEDIIYNNTIDHIFRKIEMAHLIAYQTISHWYDDVFLWSREGFITFLTAHILNQTQLHSTINLFAVQTQQESLRFDNLPINSHPLHTANIFTVHSFKSSFHYIKSSIIWRMLYHLISDSVFWTSINLWYHTYTSSDTVIQHNQSNTVQIDQLWNVIQNSLDNHSNPHSLDIKNTMNIWIKEKRYPQLFVESSSLLNRTIFYTNYKLDKNAKFLTLVTYMTKSSGDSSFWLDLQTSQIIIEGINKNDWIIVNLQQAGYYRVNYDLDNWQKLAYHLYFVKYTDIHVLNRAQIINDAFYFLMQRQLSFSLFWNITRFLINDTDYVAWYPMIKAVEYMTCIWPVQKTLKNKIKEMFDRLLLNIGYNDKFDESDFTKCLREEAVKWACVLGVHKCRQAAAFQLEKHFETSVEDKYFKWREWMYCKGLMTANYTIWSKIMLWHEWNITYNSIYSEYLTCYTNSHNIQIFLKTIMIDRFYFKTNNQTNANIILLIVAKHAKNDTVLDFIFNKFEFFQFSFKKQVDQIAILIVIITHEHNVKQLEKIHNFVKNNLSEKRLVDAVKQKIETRKLEYGRRNNNYGRLSVPINRTV